MSLQDDVLEMILTEDNLKITSNEDGTHTLEIKFKPNIWGGEIILKALKEALVNVAPKVLSESLERLARIREQEEQDV